MFTRRKVFTALIIFVCLALISAPVFAKSHSLKLQCVYNENTLGGTTTLIVAKKIEDYTNGQVKVKIFWPGQLVKVGSAYNSLSKGMIQGVAANSIYFGGIVPEVKTELMPLAWKSSQDALDLYYEKGFRDILNDAHREKGVYFGGATFAGTMVFLTKFPVRTLDDFKGKKIRAMSAFADVVKKLGASPTPMANTEQYMALRTGVIDGTVFPLDTIKNFKFYEVIDYVVLPGIFNPVTMGFFFNDKWFTSLPSDLQTKIDKAVYDTSVESMALSDKFDQGGLDVAKKENLKIVQFSDQDLQIIQKYATEGWEDIAALSPRCRKLVDLIKENLN